ncbi:MAG: hypothetical protein ACI4NE_08285 [Succinivibrio sp.]
MSLNRLITFVLLMLFVTCSPIYSYADEADNEANTAADNSAASLLHDDEDEADLKNEEDKVDKKKSKKEIEQEKKAKAREKLDSKRKELRTALKNDQANSKSRRAIKLDVIEKSGANVRVVTEHSSRDENGDIKPLETLVDEESNFVKFRQWVDKNMLIQKNQPKTDEKSNESEEGGNKKKELINDYYTPQN